MCAWNYLNFPAAAKKRLDGLRLWSADEVGAMLSALITLAASNS